MSSNLKIRLQIQKKKKNIIEVMQQAACILNMFNFVHQDSRKNKIKKILRCGKQKKKIKEL